jgi:hypothetical protein
MACAAGIEVKIMHKNRLIVQNSYHETPKAVFVYDCNG